jgi:hypothetical protein
MKRQDYSVNDENVFDHGILVRRRFAIFGGGVGLMVRTHISNETTNDDWCYAMERSSRFFSGVALV